MSALDVLRQIKQARRQLTGTAKIVEWGNADYINSIGGIENMSRRDLRNHLEARDLETTGTRLELIDRLRTSLADEQLHKFAYVETIDTEFLIQADLEERGSVYVAGTNSKGQLGLGDIVSRNVFVPIPQLRGINVLSVYAGNDICYAITDEHDLYVWGGGGNGRNGLQSSSGGIGGKKKKSVVNGDVVNWMEPAIVYAMTGEECSAVALGSSHCLALGRGGDCFVWGDGDAGQLGLGDLQHRKNICINNSFPSLCQISAGANHTAALTKNGEVYTWGHSANGRLGNGKSERFGVSEKEKFLFPIPTPLTTLEQISKISCGSDYTLAVGLSGVWGWGSGSGGKLGMGDTADRAEPCLVNRLKGRITLQVVAATWHSMALVAHPPMLKGGWLYSWGSGYQGQLAQGTVSVALLPTPVDYFIKLHLLIQTVAAGPLHCLAVTKEGELYSWGSNVGGCLGRKIVERDVAFTATPGHVAGFGALMGRIGRGFPRSITCGREFSVVVTYPYEGPDLQVASKLMEESKIREQEALIAKQKPDNDAS